MANILINPNQPNKSSWIPKFSDTMQIVEVRQTGSTYPTQLAERMEHVTGSYIVIENARPELFLRRDFIKKFVHNGTVHLSQADRDEADYRICSINNELQITLNEKQYRRFGLIAKKIIPSKAKNTKQYLIACDLKDERIMKSNKYQDKLVQTFRRLSALRQLYFRFVPSTSTIAAVAAAAAAAATTTTSNPAVVDLSASEATSESLNFFKSVIIEYAVDGFQPVPLTGCSEQRQKIQRKWLNCSQLHPDLSPSATSGIVDIVDWFGYQLLGINCDKEEIRNRYPDDQERLDVSCLQLSGMVDFKHVQEILSDVFQLRSQDSDDVDVGDDNGGGGSCNNNDENDDKMLVMRAIFLYGSQPKNSNLMIMRNFSQPIIIGSKGSSSARGGHQFLTVARMINYR